MLSLENDQLQIHLKTAGAELTKIYSKKTALDYLWKGDAKFWKRHAPVLFPIVGKLKNHTYFLGDKKFNLPQHGFARDNEFTVVSESASKIVFELSFSEKTLEIYPYQFQLFISYEIVESTLKIEYKVVNSDDKELFFSIGAHPAFSCPLTKNSDFSDYFIEFDQEETPLQYALNQDNGLREENPKPKSLGKQLDLNYELFEQDALIYKNIQSKKVSLKSTKHDHGIDFECTNWEYFAFWTKENAPFICFEPWMGAADLETTNQEFTKKDGILKLAPKASSVFEYSVSFY